MNRRPFAVALALILFGPALLGSRCAGIIQPTTQEGLRAAACKVDITPVAGVNHTNPIYLAGFDNDRQATGVHDPIWARGVVLEHGETKIAIVTLDVVGYFYNEVQTIRSRFGPERGFDAITVTSTHNHEGPDTMGLWGEDELSSGADLGYLDFINDAVVQCIDEADAAMAPAFVGFATGSTVGLSLQPDPDLVADHKILEALEIDLGEEGILQVEGDAGPVHNPSVPVMQLRERTPLFDQLAAFLAALFGNEPLPDTDPVGATIATLVNYASHPESLGSDNTLVSSDFPHAMRETVEAEYGGVAIYVAGDLGVLQGPLPIHLADPTTGDPMPRRNFAFADRMGTLLGEAAIAAVDTIAVWNGKPEIQVLTEPTLVPVESIFLKILSHEGVLGRREGLVVQDDGDFVQSETQAIRIGEAQIAVTPNELDPQIGNVYRARMTQANHRFIFGLGNDEMGYQIQAAKHNPSCNLCALKRDLRKPGVVRVVQHPRLRDRIPEQPRHLGRPASAVLDPGTARRDQRTRAVTSMRDIRRALLAGALLAAGGQDAFAHVVYERTSLRQWLQQSDRALVARIEAGPDAWVSVDGRERRDFFAATRLENPARKSESGTLRLHSPCRGTAALGRRGQGPALPGTHRWAPGAGRLRASLRLDVDPEPARNVGASRPGPGERRGCRDGSPLGSLVGIAGNRSRRAGRVLAWAVARGIEFPLRAPPGGRAPRTHPCQRSTRPLPGRFGDLALRPDRCNAAPERFPPRHAGEAPLANGRASMPPATGRSSSQI